MTEAEFRDQLELWALGGLDPAPAAAMSRFLTDQASPAVRAQAALAFETASLIAAALPTAQGDAATWVRIRAALPRPAASGAAARPAQRRGRALAVAGWLVAAAAVIALLWTWRDRAAAVAERDDLRDRAVAAERERDRGADDILAATAAERTCRADLEQLRQRDRLAGEAVALLELPGTQLIPLEAPAGATGPATTAAANAVYHRGVKRAYVVVAGLPPSSLGEYRIWLIRDGQRLEAGSLAAGPDGRAIASVPTLNLDDGVPEAFQLAGADGAVILASRVRI